MSEFTEHMTNTHRLKHTKNLLGGEARLFSLKCLIRTTLNDYYDCYLLINRRVIIKTAIVLIIIDQCAATLAVILLLNAE